MTVATAYPAPRALLDKHGLRAKKSWGQNFLGDEGILDDIARLAVEREGERVVELGAGLGHLTARLVARGAARGRREERCQGEHEARQKRELRFHVSKPPGREMWTRKRGAP